MEILWIWQNNLRITLSLFTLHPILLEALKSVINNNTHFVPEIYTSGGINLYYEVPRWSESPLPLYSHRG